MTNEGKQTNDTGSGEIPQQESPAGAGPSREVPQEDKAAPKVSAAGPAHEVAPTRLNTLNAGVPKAGVTGPANDKPEQAKKHVSGHQATRRPAKGVFRKTERLGIAPPAEPEEFKKARQRTLKNIRVPDGEIAYRPFEDSFRTFVCSLVERQERIHDEMLLHAADLQQQIDALGRQRAEQQKSPGNAEVKG